MFFEERIVDARVCPKSLLRLVLHGNEVVPAGFVSRQYCQVFVAFGFCVLRFLLARFARVVVTVILIVTVNFDSVLFVPVADGKVRFQTENGFDVRFHGGFVETPRTRKTTMVCHRDSRLSADVLCGFREHVRDSTHAVEHGELGVGVKMDEAARAL